MNKLVLFAAVALIAVAAGCVGQSSTGDLTNPRVFSVSTAEAAPMSLITINGNGFGPTAMVKFSDGRNYTMYIPSVAITSSSVKVGVPPYIDTHGNYVSGNVSVAVVQKISGSVYETNAIGHFTINALPTSGLARGKLTLDFIQGSVNRAKELQTEIVGTALNTAEMQSALSKYILVMTGLTEKIKRVVANPSSNFDLGSIDGRTMIVGSKELGDTDRLILAMLDEQATDEQPGTPLSATGDVVSPLGLAFAADVPAGCMQQEARDIVGGVPRGVIGGAEYGRPGYEMAGYYKGPTTSPLCKVAEAFGTGYTVASGAVGVAVGVAGVIVFGLGVPVGTALALPTAVLTYVALTGGAGIIAIGGHLGKSTPGAADMVRTGYRIANDQIVSVARSMLTSAILREPLGDIAEVYYGVRDLQTAYSGQSERQNQEQPTTKKPGVVPNIAFDTGTESLFALTIRWSGTGAGTIHSDPGSEMVNSGCGNNSLCTRFYKPGTKVTITNDPDGYSYFEGYHGACTGTGACEITMDSDKAIVVQFDLDVVELNLHQTGNGVGMYSTTQPRFNYNAGCADSGTCTGQFKRNSVVTITPLPSAGSTFEGFSGACSGKTACTLTMDTNKDVTGTFKLGTYTPPVIPENNTQPTEPIVPSTETVSITLSATCNQVEKVVRENGQITDYLFDIVATGTVSGPEGSWMWTQAYVDGYNTLTNYKVHPFTHEIVMGGFSVTLWTIPPNEGDVRFPSEKIERSSSQPEQTSWTNKWPLFQITDGYGYISAHDTIRVVASVTTPDGMGGDTKEVTMTCQRG